jgi:hypothetical protein
MYVVCMYIDRYIYIYEYIYSIHVNIYVYIIHIYIYRYIILILRLSEVIARNKAGTPTAENKLLKRGTNIHVHICIRKIICTCSIMYIPTAGNKLTKRGTNICTHMILFIHTHSYMSTFIYITISIYHPLLRTCCW